MQLREYQTDLSDKGAEILTEKKFLYLALEVRTGKTVISLETAKKFGAKKVLFITKIKAFSSIKSDYTNFGYTDAFSLTVINKESIHKITDNDFDLVICDEAHGLFGTYPKPNTFTKIYKKRFNRVPAILLSGTMSPESYSQMFHQFWINDFAPFREYVNFYRWGAKYVDIKLKYLGYAEIKDYSVAKIDLIREITNPYTLTFTQASAGFTTNINEVVLTCKMKPITYNIVERLKRDLIVEGKDKVILADTAVKLQQKLHQLYSGTVKFEDGSSQIIDNSKAEFIKSEFAGRKIAIFYKFKAELEMLKQTFGNDITEDLEEFNNSSKWIACQIIKFREGVSLRAADCLVYINIDFSAVSYFQSRDRLTYKERTENNIYWIFSEDGIEKNIYKAVMNKKNYTLSTFKKDVRISDTK